MAAGGTSILATCLLFLVPVLMPAEDVTDIGELETDKKQSVESQNTIVITCTSSDPTDEKMALDVRDVRASTNHLGPSLRATGLLGSSFFLDIPKRASMGSMLGLNHVPVPPPTTFAKRERFLIVERVSQV